MQNMQTMQTMELDSSSNNLNSTLSLYIPSIGLDITQADLSELFLKQKIGVVSRADFVYNTKGVRQVFLHFSSWFNTESNRLFQEKILNEKSTAIIKTKLIDNKSQLFKKFKSSNIILLPNRNPRSDPNNELLDSLIGRISLLESRLKEFEDKDELVLNNKRTRT